LPSPTSKGANTFGCLMDGKAWIPEGSTGLFASVYPTSGGFFDEVDSTMSIYIMAYGNNDEMTIYLKNGTAVGTYYLNKNTSTKPSAVLPEASYGTYDVMYEPEYVTDSIHTGVVTITHADLSTGIVSGTFDMQLYQKSTGKTITVSHGRFDYKTHT
jgi:uncharacterized protein DUF6252